MNLPNVAWNHCLWWGFYLCIKHFEDELEWWIINNREWLMALKDPMWDEILKFGFIVCGSMHIAGNDIGWISDLAITGLGVVKKVCCRIFLTFTSQNNWGVSIALWDQMSQGKKSRDLHLTNELILNDIVLRNYNWHLEVTITSWSPIPELRFYMEGTRCQKKKKDYREDSDLLRTSSFDLVAVSYLSSNAESLVRTRRGASLPGDDSLAHFLVRTMLEEMGLVMYLV